MGESCAVTCAEGYQAVNETSGTLMWAYDEVAGDVVLEVAVSKRLSVVCSLDDPSTHVRHASRDPSYRSSVITCKEGYEAGGNISTTFSLCPSSGEIRQRGTNCLFVVFADVLF